MSTSAKPASRSYFILGINHDQKTMEVHFNEDGHTYRLNLWLPDDPAKIDQAIRDAWPHADFDRLRGMASRKPDYDAALGKSVNVENLMLPELPAPASGGLGIHKPAT